MPINFACSCGHRLRISDDLAGKRVRCPTCKQPQVAPKKSEGSTAKAPNAGATTHAPTKAAIKRMTKVVPPPGEQAEVEPPESKSAATLSNRGKAEPTAAKSRGKSLLIAVTLLALVLMLLGGAGSATWMYLQSARQQEAITLIERFGGKMKRSPDGKTVFLVNLRGKPIIDTDLIALGNLQDLEFLFLDNTKITDQGLEHLKPLSKLKVLSLAGTNTSLSAIRGTFPNADGSIQIDVDDNIKRK